MNFAIIRLAKLRTEGSIASSAHHNFRSRPTPNADPERTPLNTTTGAQTTDEVLDKVKLLIASVKTVRKNAVLAIEYLITSSRKLNTEEETIAYLNEGEAWIRDRHGSGNVVHATQHWDESTPHLSMIVVPIDPKGKVNASHFLDGRVRLARMQTDFFKQVGEPFGLERGVEGSTAKHISIQEYYARINADSEEPLTEIPAVPAPTDYEIWAESIGKETEHSKAVAAAAAARKKRDAEIAERLAIYKAKANEADLIKRQLKDQAAGIARFRKSAVVLRDMELKEILERLGCQRDPKKRMNWRTQVGLVTLEGLKFHCHSLGRGGTGAVDLVMMVEDTDYQGALNLLCREFSSEEVLAERMARTKQTLQKQIEEAASTPVPAFQLPARSIRNWPTVANYMTTVWKLSDALVETLHTADKVYADECSNVVFVLNGGIGVQLHGTGKGPAFRGFKGSRAEFETPQSEVKKLAFVKDSVSAICLLELGFDGTIVGLNGKPGSSVQVRANKMRQEGYEVFAAFPNDHAGDKDAQALGLDIERLRPKLKDWKQDLVAGRKFRFHDPIHQQPDDETQDDDPREDFLRER